MPTAACPVQPAAEPTSPDRGPGAVLLWAALLGVSWTWVIGMVLPALLVRDYGGWGWVVFAAPNVIGAAAMGFVLARAGQSERLVREHLAACVGFSRVTVLYHVFVTGWLGWLLFGAAGPIGYAALTAAAWLILGGTRRQLWAAAAIAGVSLACLGVGAGLPGAWAGVGTTPAEARLGPASLWLSLAPGAVLGFALCPYLDLSFHRARQQLAPSAGRAAFTLGFGGVFLAMIVLSLCYAGVLGPVIDREPGAAVPRGWLVLLAVHGGLQAAFTTALHLRMVERYASCCRVKSVAVWALLGLPLAAMAVMEPGVFAHGITLGEWVYRLILGCYGLVFPAYVWLCVWPLRRAVSLRARVTVWAGAVLTAAPLTYAGLVASHPAWTLPAIGVLLGARGLLVWLGRSAPLPVPPADAPQPPPSP